MRGVLAPAGCVLPGMKKPLAQRTVAGTESYGMMCSAPELGLSGDDKNIIELGVLVKEHFGEKAEPLYPRLAKFFQILASYGFVSFK